MSGNDAQTKVAIMAASEQGHTHLSTLLADAGLDVVLQEVAGENFINQLEQTSADVLLVDLGDDTSSETDIIDTLLEYDSLPVFFNDSSHAGSETDALWAKKLARRLQQLVRDFEPDIVEPVEVINTESAQQEKAVGGFSLELSIDSAFESGTDQQMVEQIGERVVPELSSTVNMELEPLIEGEPDPAPVSANETDPEFVPVLENEIGDEIEALPQQTDTAAVVVKESPGIEMPEEAAVNVWVLGASLGGPQAVRQFLMAVREDLPVAFVLAQHIGENHISLLAEQLDRVTKFRVFPGYNGHMVRHHEVILAPAGKNIHFTDDGYISLSDQPENAIYSPCINDVMTAVARHYGNMAGTIVFSGMGDDGAIGCQAVADNGGIVWAQDVDSCVISSMPDQARKTNNVTFSANPRRLADELYKYYTE